MIHAVLITILFLSLEGCKSTSNTQKAYRALNELGDVLELDLLLSGWISTKQEEEFFPYLEEWTKQGARKPTFGIRFTQKSEGFLRQSKKNVAGYCIFYPSGVEEVRIKRSVWEKVSILKERANTYDLYKELILFHELGHCLLRRFHNEGTIKSPSNSNAIIPKSIMHPDLNKVVPHYKNNRLYYIKELLGK